MLRQALGASVGWLGISMVADGVPALLLPHQLLADGSADATRLGLIALVAIAIAALIQPGAGWLSDRIGRLPVIWAGTMLAVVGVGLLLIPDGAVAGTVVALAGVSVAQAGQQALLPDRIQASWRGRAGGLKSAFDVAGAFAGFLILAALLGSGQVAVAVGVLVVVLVGGATVARALLGPKDPEPRALGETQEPTDVARLVRLVAARFLFLLGIYAVGRFLLLFVADRFDLGADAAGGQAGLILAVLALVTVACSIPGGWLADRVGRRPLMLFGAAIAALGIWLLPSAGSLPAIVGFGSLMAVGSAAFGSASWAMLGDLVRPSRAGTLMGFANLGTAGAAAAAGLFGPVVDGAGFGPAVVLAAGSTAIGGVLALTLADAHLTPRSLVGSTEGAH